MKILEIGSPVRELGLAGVGLEQLCLGAVREVLRVGISSFKAMACLESFELGIKYTGVWLRGRSE